MSQIFTDKDKRVGCQGFTLIEVLVAVAVLATSIVLIMQAFDTSIVALSTAREIIVANHLAKERLNNMCIAARGYEPGAVSTGSGRFAAPYSDFKWEVITDTVDAGLPSHSNILEKVTVNISRDNSSRTCSTITYLRSKE